MFKRLFDEILWTIRYDENVAEFVHDVLYGNTVIKIPYLHEALKLIGLNEYLLDEEYDRMIQFLRKDFKSEEFLQVLKVTDEMLGKNDTVARMLMNKSEDFSESSDYPMALRSLNIALAFASKKTLGNVYRKRSSWIFTHVANWDICLKDTELGLEMDCPVTMRQELNLRKLKCLGMYNKTKAQKPEVLAKEEYRDGVLFQLYKGRNEKIPAASSVVEIRWNEKTGRGLFVTEDVDPGSTLIIEEPYVVNLIEGLSWDVDYCWRCLKRMESLTPCDSCVFAVYCTEKCRLEDLENGHQYECTCLNYFHGAASTTVNSNSHIAYKAICKSGPLELYKIFTTLKMSGTRKMDNKMGYDPKTGTFDSTSYWSIMSMKSHVENNGRLPEHIWVALSFTEILDQKTDFFAQICDDTEKKCFKEFVATLALMNTLSVPFNCVGLSEIDHDIDINKFQSKLAPFAGGLYPVVSLMNHSCDPSVSHVNLSNGRMAIMTLRGLKAGDELFMSYGYEYVNNSLKMRQEILLEQYLFKCRCSPCQFNWPNYEELRKNKNKFRCPECSDKFNYDQSNQCALEETNGNGYGKCPLCLKEFSFQSLIDEVQSRASVLEMAKKFLLANEPVSAINILLDHVEFLQSKLCPPAFPLCAAQRILLKAYYLIMGN